MCSTTGGFRLSHSMTEVLLEYHESQILAEIQLMYSPSFADDCSVDESPPRAVTRGVQGHLSVRRTWPGKEMSPGSDCTQRRNNPAVQGTQWTNGYWLLKTLFSCLFSYSSALKSLVARIYKVLCRGTMEAGQACMEAIWLGFCSTIPQYSIDC